jgi:L-alanine-DL-glutamate epimerase-like enolase superfamily enzyme
MRIERIEAEAIAIPLSRDFGGSTYHVTRRCTVITRVYSQDGLVGEVYNGDNRDHAAHIARMIVDQLTPLVLGEDPFAVERVWQKLFAQTIAAGDRKVMLEAIACIDCALWDLMGKSLGKPVRDLLGGFCDALPIISIGGYYVEGKTYADIGREMEMYRDAGMAGCKFKVGGLSPAEDAKRVEAARKAAGDDFMLAVDANRGWDVEHAIRFAHLVEPLDIRWFEEPCHWYDDARMMARVRAATHIPITAGQSEITSQGVRRLIDAGAVDLVNYDVSEGGGVTDWRRAAAICGAVGVKMAHHEESQISIQLLTAIPHGTYVECFADPERDPVWQNVWCNRPAVKNGLFALPEGSGFGIELDRKMLAKYRIGA